MASSSLLPATTQRSNTKAPAQAAQNTIKRPWSLLHSTLSLSPISLSQQELTSELLSRLPQLRRPLAPFGKREAGGEGRLKATLGADKDKGKDSAAAGAPALGAKPKAGGNPLFVLATTNAAKEAAAGGKAEPASTEAREKDAATEGSTRLRTFAASEMDSTPSMIEDALSLSEEFGIDEVESYVLLRSLIWNKGVPMPVEVDTSPSSSSFEKSNTPINSSSTFGAGGKAGTSTRTIKTYSADIDIRIPQEVLFPLFAEFLAEEVLALTRSVTCLCIAWRDKGHPWNEVAATVLPKVIEEETPKVPTTSTGASTSSTGADAATSIGEKDAVRYVDMLLKEYTLRAGLPSAEDDEAEKGSTTRTKGKGTTAPAAALALFKSTAAKGNEDSETPSYRSLAVSQILLEQHAILELLFWFLWQAFIPWSHIALAILKVGYRCDLGLRLNAPTPSGAAKSAGLGAFAYLEDKDKNVLKNVEMMWMLLCVSVFDITQLLNGPITLDMPMAVTGPDGTILNDDDDPSEASRYTRIYDPRLLPQLYELLSSTPPNNPRYAPILLAWAFVLSCVSRAAVEVGELLPRQYIPFLQTIIPEFSVDTIGDRTSEIGGWMSSLITSFVVGDLGVLAYLDTCIKGGGDDLEKPGHGVFNGEEWGQGSAFGPPIYREVVKRSCSCPTLFEWFTDL